MKLYLETVSFDESIEINQYVPLDGIIMSMDLLIKDPSVYSIEETAKKLLEALMPSQDLFVPIVQSDFRAMVSECRKMNALAENIICLLPASPAGYMAMKVCGRQKIRAAAWNALSPEQLVFAGRNDAILELADVKSVNRTLSLEDFLNQADALPDHLAEEKLVITGLRTPAAYRSALLKGCAGIGADYDLYQELLLSEQAMKEQSEVLQNWMEKELTADDLEDSAKRDSDEAHSPDLK